MGYWRTNTWTLTLKCTLCDQFPVVFDFSLSLNMSIAHVIPLIINTGINFNCSADKITDVDVHTKNLQVLSHGSFVTTTFIINDYRNCRGNIKHESETSNGVDITSGYAGIASWNTMGISWKR